MISAFDPNILQKQGENAKDSGLIDRLQRMARTVERGEALSSEQAQGIRKQAEQFEAMFLSKMIETMRKTVQESDLFGDPESPSRGIYRSMLDSEYSKLMAETQNFGLAEMIMDQFGLSPDDGRVSPVSPSGLLPQLTPGEADPDRPTFTAPLVGRISSPFGMREDPFNDQLRMHNGIDLAVPVGTRVHAMADGEVVFAGKKSGYGNVVIIDHGKDMRSVYGHLSEINVEVGDSVRRGRSIAHSGNTGRSTGPHLHFEIRLGGKPVNPATLVTFPVDR